MVTIHEADVEEIALNHLRDLGWSTTYGPDIERDYSQVFIEDRLRTALADLNPDLPDDALQSTLRKLTQPVSTLL